jgi:hypothetical protein
VPKLRVATTPSYDPNIRQPQPQYVQQVRPDRKDPFTAGLGSLIIVGVGQFYVGKWWRGIGFMALAILFFWATIPMSGLGVIVIWILAPIDAYDQAKKHNIKYGYSEEAIGEAEHGEEEGLRPQELWVEGQGYLSFKVIIFLASILILSFGP